MTGMMRFWFLILCIFIQPAIAEGLHIRDAVGGRARAMVLADSYWYQAVGDRLEVLLPQSASDVATILLAEHPAGSECTELILIGNTLYALMEGHAVVVLDCTNPRVPVITKRLTQVDLGLQPKGLKAIGSWAVAFGEFGAVLLPDSKAIVDTPRQVQDVSMSIDHGVVYISEGMIFDADTDAMYGNATELHILDESADAPFGTLVSLLNTSSGVEMRLLHSDLTMVNASSSVVNLSGVYHSTNIHGNRIFVMLEDSIEVFSIAPESLTHIKSIAKAGVYDLGVIGSNYLALAGNFGFGIYRIDKDRGGEGDTLLRVTQAASAFAPGKHNVWGVQIPALVGSAYYKYDEAFSFREEQVEPIPSTREAVILGWRAAIDPNTSEVFMVDAEDSLVPLPIPTASSLVPISGNFWVGTSNAIYVFGDDGSGNLVELASIGMAGPIVQLIPMFDGSAAFVSEAGFVGVVEQSQ